jgi:hypothetical protein
MVERTENETSTRLAGSWLAVSGERYTTSQGWTVCHAGYESLRDSQGGVQLLMQCSHSPDEIKWRITAV